MFAQIQHKAFCKQRLSFQAKRFACNTVSQQHLQPFRATCYFFGKDPGRYHSSRKLSNLVKLPMLFMVYRAIVWQKISVGVCSHHMGHRHGSRRHGGRAPASCAAHGFGLPVRATSQFLLPRLCPLHIWPVTHIPTHTKPVVFKPCPYFSERSIFVSIFHRYTNQPTDCQISCIV